MTISAIGFGLSRCWDIKKLIAFFWFLNIGIAILFLQPYLSAFTNFFQQREVTEILASRNIFTYYAEFIHFMKPAVQFAQRWVLAGFLLYIILAILLSGGLVYYFVNTEPTRLKIFLLESARFADRMLRLIPVIIILFITLLLIGVILPLPFSYLLPSPFVENVYFYFFFGWGLFILLLFWIGFLLTDLIRIDIIRTHSRSVIYITLQTLTRFMKNPLPFLKPYFSLMLGGSLLFLLYWWTQQFIPDNTWWGILFGFLLLQLFVIIQYWFKFSKIGALVYVIENDSEI